jgi:hypothetical protein
MKFLGRYAISFWLFGAIFYLHPSVSEALTLGITLGIAEIIHDECKN